MKISTIHANAHNQSMQVQQSPERKAHQPQSAGSNQQKQQGQDVVKRKKESQQMSIGEEKLIEMIEQANIVLLKPPTELQFSVHEETKRISIKIINTENQEVLKEIPPEKLLDMIAKVWEIAGLLVDEKG